MDKLVLLAALAAACAPVDDRLDLLLDDGAASPPPGALALRASQAVPGEPMTLAAAGAAPGAAVTFALGADLGAGPCFPWGCVDLLAPVALGVAVADAGGVARLTWQVPEGELPGALLSLQAAALQGRRTRVSPGVQAPVSAPLWFFGTWEAFGEAENHVLRTVHGDFEVVRHDNARPSVVVRDVATGAYARYDGDPAGRVCLAVVGAATPRDALAPPQVGVADPCPNDGGAWVTLVEEGPALGASLSDEWGTLHTISSTAWVQSSPFFSASFEVARWSNLEGWLVARNAPTNDFFPDLWSRFDWVADASGTYYCQTAFAAPTEWAARVTSPADPSDLAAGCGGFPWTRFLP